MPEPSEKVIFEALQEYRSVSCGDLSDEERAEIAASAAILDDMSDRGWKTMPPNIAETAEIVLKLADQM